MGDTFTKTILAFFKPRMGDINIKNCASSFTNQKQKKPTKSKSWSAHQTTKCYK